MLILVPIVMRITRGGPVGQFTLMLDLFFTVLGLALLLAAALRRGLMSALLFGGAVLLAGGVFVVQSGLLGGQPAAPREERASEEPGTHAPLAEAPVDEFSKKSGPRRESPFNSAPMADDVSIEDRSAVSGTAGFTEGVRTELVGGSGGGPFCSVSPAGEPVLGISHSMGSWAGVEAVARLEPLFDRSSEGFLQIELAREGYALGALDVDAAQYVNAVRPVFMRVGADGRLDPADCYPGEWIGTSTGHRTKTLGGTGAKVIGIHGRRAAVVDAVGLVLGESK
jgi:hypothetical protein